VRPAGRSGLLRCQNAEIRGHKPLRLYFRFLFVAYKALDFHPFLCDTASQYRERNHQA
jgi:hypothetical protein